MSEWKIIDTLPESGVVLGYFPNERDYKRYNTIRIRDGKPFTVGDTFAFDRSNPTHWMNLPEAPKS